MISRWIAFHFGLACDSSLTQCGPQLITQPKKAWVSPVCHLHFHPHLPRLSKPPTFMIRSVAGYDSRFRVPEMFPFLRSIRTHKWKRDPTSCYLFLVDCTLMIFWRYKKKCQGFVSGESNSQVLRSELFTVHHPLVPIVVFMHDSYGRNMYFHYYMRSLFNLSGAGMTWRSREHRVV